MFVKGLKKGRLNQVIFNNTSYIRSGNSELSLTIKNYYLKKINLSDYIIMSAKNINVNDKKIRKSDFYKNKKIFQIDDINLDNILVSKKEPHGS